MYFLPPKVYRLQEWELGKCQVPREKLGRAWLPGPHPHPELWRYSGCVRVIKC